jgi:hypothetical protein
MSTSIIRGVYELCQIKIPTLAVGDVLKENGDTRMGKLGVVGGGKMA